MKEKGVKTMNLRSRKIIALLLSISLILSMGIHTAAAPAGEYDILNDYQSDAGLSALITTEINSEGWRAESDDEHAVVSFASDPGYTEALISLNNLTNYKSYSETYDYCKDTNITFAGSTDSRSLVISISDNRGAIKKKANKKTLNNSVCIRVEMGSTERPKTDVYVQKFRSSSGIEKGVINIEAGEGVTVEESENDKYYIYSFITDRYMMVSHNIALNKKSKVVGLFTVNYYGTVPNYGKGFNPKKYSSYIGNITVSDNYGNEYVVKKAKLVMLKNAPKDQGPFPDQPNAGLQIISVKSKLKVVNSALKKATKVKKSDSLANVALPVIVYPLRLTEEGLFSRVKNGKKYYCTVKITGKKGKYKVKIPKLHLTYKGGAKDSFGSGKIFIDIDRENKVLRADCADVWTGYDGLSLSYNYVQDNTKGR